MKSNKSLLKRIRVTKNKKIVARISGQNHFNSKESGNVTRAKRANQTLGFASITKAVRKHVINH